MTKDVKIGFLGAGRMASAIAGGLRGHGFETERILAYDCAPAALENFCRASGGTGVAAAPDLARECGVILLAVKPQYLAPALEPLRGMLDGKLVLSIVAGVKLAKLAALTGASRIVRIMPNTPALVGAGCGAYAVAPAVTAEDRLLALQVLESIGAFEELEERHLDAVTALSGCGPAYVYELIQAMADGGVTLGLPRALALKLAAETVRGSALMVTSTGTHPVELRDQVCSPGGATIMGVNVLARRGFSSAVIDAEIAACERSAELGGK